MKITVLAENTSVCALPAEHGLSLFVEAAGRRFLFDTGASSLFARNADALGIDLDAADFAVLSHGHNDHGGGLRTLFERNAHAPVYASRYAFEPHFNAADKDIGLDPTLQDTGRFILVDGDLQISEGLTLYPACGPELTSSVAPAICRPTPADGPTSSVAPATCRPTPADGPTSSVAPATCRPTPADGPTSSVAPATCRPPPVSDPTSSVAPAICRPLPADGPTSSVAPAICRPLPADGPTPYVAPATCRPTPAFDPGGLKTMRNGRLIPEDFRHEQYLLVEEHGRRVLFSGCSHRGVVNLMRRFRPDILIGGFHFFRLPLDDTLAAYAATLDAFPAAYYTCHCTGEAQYAFLKERMQNLHYLSTGDSVEV